PLLSHLRVVDLTDLRGALAGRMLADLGADVVKVEPPGGDTDRLREPFVGDVPGPDRSLPFLYRNLGKRRTAIDLGDAEGWRRFVELCENADVLIENVAVGDPLRARLSPADVHARHPRLVHVTIADFGLDGPRASWRLEPLPAFAAAGALLASRLPGTRLRRDRRDGGRARRPPRPGPARRGTDGRGLRPGSGDGHARSVGDPARRLRPRLPGPSALVSARRGRAGARAPDRGRPRPRARR